MSEVSDGSTAAVLARVAARLAGRAAARVVVAPGEPTPRRAAVALVLRPGTAGGAELLFVKRAEYPGDPWSGHVAFPGGRQEPGDPSLWATAVRETAEETGLDLAGGGRLLGELDELHPRTPLLPPIVVRPHVVAVGHGEPLTLSAELTAAFWIPLARFREAGVDVPSEVQARGGRLQVSSFVHEGHVIWGMTERILRQFLGLLSG